MEQIYIEDMKEDKKVEGYFGVKEKNVRTSRSGNLYLDLTLVDHTGQINAKMWNDIKEVKDTFSEGDAVAIKGYISLYNQKLQMTIQNIRPVREEDKQHGYDFVNLIKSSEKNLEEVWNSLQDIIETIGTEELKTLTQQIYTKWEEQLKVYPAAMKLHHAYRGGLLEHIHNCTKNAVSIGQNYPDYNLDLIKTGALLHEIGKIKELTPGINIDYTDKGNFAGHLVLGRDILIENIREIDNFSEILQNKLEHILLSHHGRLEWSSPKEPSFPEAAIIYYSDKVDTYLEQMQNAIDEDRSDGDWTGNRNYFHRVLYKK